MLQKRQSSRGDGKDTLRSDCVRAHLNELPDRRVEKERRIVVAVASSRAVDEHEVALAELRTPAAPFELARESAKSRAPLLLGGRVNRVVVLGRRTWAR